MDILSKIKERLNPATIAAEVYKAVENSVAHGASELAHALFTGSAYVPYGNDIGAPQAVPDPGGIEPPATPQQAYEIYLTVAAPQLDGPDEVPLIGR